MQSAANALTWEFWRRGWVWILIAPVALSCPLLLVYALLGLAETASFRGTDIGRQLHWTFYICALLYIPTTLLWLQPGLTRRFPLPLSTCSIVGWSMVNTAAAAVFIYWVLAGLLNVLCDAGWPWWAPALFAATVTVCVQAIIWSLMTSRFLQGVGCLVAVGVFVPWLAARYGINFPSGPTRMWASITLGDVLMMSGAAAGAYAVAVVGVARIRCGEGWNIRSLASRLAELVDTPFNLTSPPFLTRNSAQLWFEWRQRGLAFPAFVLVLSAIVFVWCVSPYREAKDVVDLIGGLSVMAMLASGLVGMYVGHRTAAWGFGSYYATRPVDSNQLARAILINTVATTLLAAAIWGLMSLLAFGFFVAIGYGDIVSRELDLASPSHRAHFFYPHLTAGVLFLCATWTAVALGASLALARGWFVLSVFYSSTLGFIGAILMINFVVPEQLVWLVDRVLVTVLGAGMLLATVIAFVAARRKNLIGDAATWIATGWVVVSAICLTLIPTSATDQWHAMLFVLGLLSLPCAPFAAAPLAVSWNRHR